MAFCLLTRWKHNCSCLAGGSVSPGRCRCPLAAARPACAGYRGVPAAAVTALSPHPWVNPISEQFKGATNISIWPAHPSAQLCTQNKAKHAAARGERGCRLPPCNLRIIACLTGLLALRNGSEQDPNHTAKQERNLEECFAQYECKYVF